MPFTTFVPPKSPVLDGATVETNAAVREAKFGDGYAQRVPDGINTISKGTTLFWRGLSAANALAIETFFAGLLGTTPFIYQVPGDFAARQWVCKKWTMPMSDGVYYQMSADLVQDFSLA